MEEERSLCNTMVELGKWWSEGKEDLHVTPRWNSENGGLKE